MIKAVILDVDDTLCQTEATCFAMENEVLASMGRPAMTREVHQSNWGMVFAEAIAQRSPGIDVRQFQAAYLPISKNYIERGLLDSIPEEHFQALEILKRQGIELFVVTSRTHSELEHLLAPHHRLGKYIASNAFYHRNNMDFHKPDPRAFKIFEQRHGLRADQCVYVGDSLGDAAAATGGGLKFIASLQSGLRSREDFHAYPVDAFIDNFTDIVSAVNSLSEA